MWNIHSEKVSNLYKNLSSKERKERSRERKIGREKEKGVVIRSIPSKPLIFLHLIAYSNLDDLPLTSVRNPPKLTT